MLRKVSAALLALAGFFIIVISLAWVLLPRQVANDTASRKVARTVLWSGGDLGVTLDLSPPPVQPCPRETRPLDIVLLVDTSESMQGEPLRLAQEAVKVFVQNTDLQVHRLALFLFSKQVVEMQPLTGDRPALLDVLDSAVANDGTAIEIALHAARQELMSYHHRLNAGTLIILLSDGGSDPRATLQEARLARDQGIQIAVVALKGENYNSALLHQVATSTYTFFPAQSADELGAIYTKLAEAVNRVVATNLQVTEPMGESFRVLSDTLTPAGTLTDRQIQWSLGWLTTSSDPLQNLHLAYRVQATQWGLHAPVEDQGAFQMVDCSGVPQFQETPPGPRVLVLPRFLPWILGGLALLGVLGLLPLAGFLGRFRREEPSPQDDSPPERPSHSPSPAKPVVGQKVEKAKGLFKKWLAGNEKEDWSAYAQEEGFIPQPPMAIVGLGDTGKRVLQFVADYLDARWGKKWPTNVHLLYLDARKSDSSEHELSSGERFPGHILFPRLGRLRADQITSFTGNPQYPGRGRDLGRLAVYDDLSGGKARSQLWGALRNLIGDLKETEVFVVADAFSNAGSGMIADIAHLLRLVAPAQIAHTRLFLAMQHAEWQDRLTPARRTSRTFATLRELQRLQRRTPVRFSYAPGIGEREMDAALEKNLFDEIVLFDGKGLEAGAYTMDVSSLPAKEGLLPIMADSLISLLDPGISYDFHQNWANQVSGPLRHQDKPLENFASAMGCYSLRLPVEEMRRTMACRLVHQFLFDRREGWIGWEDLDKEGKPLNRGQVNVPAVSELDIESFWRTTGLDEVGVQRLSDQDLRRYVLNFLEVKINQEPGTRIRWGLQFVERLKAGLPGHGKDLDRIGDSLRTWIRAVGETSQQTGEEEIDLVDQFFGITTEQETARADLKPGDLYHCWQQQWESAQAVFERLAGMHAERLLWNRDQAFQLYRDYVPADALERMRKRVWWLWSANGRSDAPSLRLLVLPSVLGETDPDDPLHTRYESILRNPAACAYVIDQPEDLIDALMTLASAMSREIYAVKLAAYLEEADKIASEMLKKSGPLYREKQVGGAEIAVVPFRYFAGPDPNTGAVADLAEAVERQLAGAGTRIDPGVSRGRSQARRIAAKDPTACRLLQVEHMVSIHTMEAYALAKERYTPRPDLHVFPEELVAVRWEEQAEPKLSADAGRLVFTPYFVELLYRHEEAMRLYGRCLIYRLIRLDASSLQIIGCADDDLQERLAGRSAHDAALDFAQLVERSPEVTGRLEERLDEQMPDDYHTRVQLLDDRRDELVVHLSNRDNSEAHDVALLLAAILVEEERRD